MATQLYPKAREKFATAQLNWIAGTWRGLLLPETYSPNFADEFLAAVPAGSRIASSDAITGRTATNGFCTSDPIKFGLLVDSRRASKLLIYRDTSDEATSDLVVFLDSESLLGVPLSLLGLDYFFLPNSIDGGIFRL